MLNFLRKYKVEIVIFILALFARSILVSINLYANDYNIVNTIHGDDGYYEISQGILSGNGFTGFPNYPFSPNPLRPPLWPYMIAFIVWIFGSYWAVAIVEILIGSLIPVLGFIITKKIFKNSKIALGTGILMALEPYSVLLSSLLYSETIFTFLFLIFVYFLIRYFENQTDRNLIWMVVFMSLATLAKVTIQYIPIVLASVIAFVSYKESKKIKWKDIIIVLGIFLLFIWPWLYRNYIEFGKVGMSAQPAFNLYVYLVPTVLSIDNQTSFADEHKKFVKRGNFDENNINLANGEYYTKIATAILLDHKFALIKSGMTTLVTFFTHDGLVTILQNAHITLLGSGKPALSMLFADPINFIKYIISNLGGFGLLIIIMRLMWIAITGLFFFGIYRYLKWNRLNPGTFMVLFLVTYFALTTAINGLGVNARFKIPILVFIFSFALYGLFTKKWIISRLQN